MFKQCCNMRKYLHEKGRKKRHKNQSRKGVGKRPDAGERSANGTLVVVLKGPAWWGTKGRWLCIVELQRVGGFVLSRYRTSEEDRDQWDSRSLVQTKKWVYPLQRPLQRKDTPKVRIACKVKGDQRSTRWANQAKWSLRILCSWRYTELTRSKSCRRSIEWCGRLKGEETTICSKDEVNHFPLQLALQKQVIKAIEKMLVVEEVEDTGEQKNDWDRRIKVLNDWNVGSGRNGHRSQQALREKDKLSWRRRYRQAGRCGRIMNKRMIEIGRRRHSKIPMLDQYQRYPSHAAGTTQKRPNWNGKNWYLNHEKVRRRWGRRGTAKNKSMEE